MVTSAPLIWLAFALVAKCSAIPPGQAWESWDGINETIVADPGTLRTPVGIGYPVDTQFAFHTIDNQLYAVPYQPAPLATRLARQSGLSAADLATLLALLNNLAIPQPTPVVAPPVSRVTTVSPAQASICPMMCQGDSQDQLTASCNARCREEFPTSGTQQGICLMACSKPTREVCVATCGRFIGNGTTGLAAAEVTQCGRATFCAPLGRAPI
jgi:hypothetical protein